MKIVEPALIDLLKQLAEGRVYLLQAPVGTLGSYIVLQKTDSDTWRSINGPSGIAQDYIQIDCYGEEIYNAKRLAAQVKGILDGYSGTVEHDPLTFEDGGQQTSVKIAGISLQNDVDMIDQTDDPDLFRNTASYLVTYYQ